VIFTGEYNAKLNAKNQVTLPGPLRDAIFFNSESIQLVLFARNEGEFIEIYLGENWLEIQKKVEDKALELKDPSLNRKFNQKAHAFVMEKSGNGRILIPSKFIQFLKPTDELTFIGNTAKIEIWNSKLLIRSNDTEKTIDNEQLSSILSY